MHRILLVDDDKNFREIAREILVLDGFQVTEASNGFEAIESFRNSQPDLVILDLNMPEMDGMEATIAINAINPSIPVIILTGEREMISTPDAFRLGAHYFLTKPPDYNELIAIIKVAISRQKLKVRVRS